MIYFTSDWHFGHERMIKGFRSKDFSSVEEHDKIIEDNIFSTLKRGDTLYFLGDAFWTWNNEQKKKFFDRIRGHSIQFFWVRGNHDKPFSHKAILWTGDLKEIKYNKKRIIMCHYPMLCWNSSHHGSLNFHGHIHNGDKTYYRIAETQYYTGKHINVNLEFYDYRPVSIETLLEKAELLPENWDYIPKEEHSVS